MKRSVKIEVEMEKTMKDVESLLNKIDQDVKERLSEKRYIHSIGVMKKAEELAKKYGEDTNKAKLIGLAHDIAKEMLKEEIIKYVQNHHILVDEYEKENFGLLHGKIGADFCKEKYGFTEDMQKAIEYHTTGSPQMDNLAKIIFIADKIEDGRNYIDIAKIKQKEEKGLDNLLIYELDNAMMYIIEKEKIMHPNTVMTRNYFLSCIKK